jgi:hypothetical protein
MIISYSILGFCWYSFVHRINAIDEIVTNVSIAASNPWLKCPGLFKIKKLWIIIEVGLSKIKNLNLYK